MTIDPGSNLRESGFTERFRGLFRTVRLVLPIGNQIWPEEEKEEIESLWVAVTKHTSLD
jgi:hypothetical protein